MMTRRRLTLAAVGAAAIVFGPVATSQLTLTAPRSSALLLADVAVGWSMIAAGLILADRRAGNRLGPLAVAAGFAWFAGDFTSARDIRLAYLASVGHGWFDPLFALVILAYPRGRIEGRAARALALGFIAVQAAWSVAKAYGLRPIAWWDCPTCMTTVDRYIATSDALDLVGRAETAALTALSVGVLGLVAVRWLRASGAARARHAPALLAGVVLALGFTGGFLLQTVAPDSARSAGGELRMLVLAVLRILVAVALLVGVLRTDAARSRIADLVTRLDSLPSLPVLRDSLRDALRDPSLEVYRWDETRGDFTDEHGERSASPPSGTGRSSLTIDGPAGPALRIVHDASLEEDPGLMAAAVAAVRLSIENERLQAEVHAQLEAVQASRARLVEAGDAERRRIERDLHDGAQQRLVSLQISLQLLRRRLGPDADPAAIAELDAAAAEAARAIGEVRELARGVHPAVLTEAGLDAALASLAERSAVPVDLHSEVNGRLPGPVEATAYFVVAEALTNVARHANARQVRIRAERRDGRLHVEVADDGRGGASLDAGTGLRGLEDRVSGLGGSLELTSPAGAGTRITVELPCASS